jgi:uncharacterized protein
MQRLHQLTLEIMTTDDTREFIERLMERLAGDFEAGSVRLHLISPTPRTGRGRGRHHSRGPVPDWFEDILDRGKIVFGRLTRAKLEMLFPNRHESVGSAALVPVNHTGCWPWPSAGRFNDITLRVARFNPELTWALGSL